MYPILGIVRRSAGGVRVSRSVFSYVVKARWMWAYQWSPVCLWVGNFGFAKDVGVSGWCQYVRLSGSSRVVGSLSLVVHSDVEYIVVFMAVSVVGVGCLPLFGTMSG